MFDKKIYQKTNKLSINPLPLHVRIARKMKKHKLNQIKLQQVCQVIQLHTNTQICNVTKKLPILWDQTFFESILNLPTICSFFHNAYK